MPEFPPAKDMLKFCYFNLIRIRLQHNILSFKTYNCYTINVRMLLKTNHRVNYYWTTIYMHELPRDILSPFNFQNHQQ